MSEYSALDDKAKQDLKRKRKLAVGGALGGAALGLGLGLLSRRGIRARTQYDIKALFSRGPKKDPSLSEALPKEAVRDAKRVIRALRAAGLNPAKARIGLSGTPGTGKTTLARAIAEQTGMSHRKLRVGTVSERKGGHDRVLELNPVKPGTIVEQTHLLTQAKPEKFDAIIRLDRPTQAIRAGLFKRKRGAHQADLYDYDKLRRDIAVGFNTAKGNVKVVSDARKRGGARISLKAAPREGFQSDRGLDIELLKRGINPEGLLRSQKIQSITSGKRTKSRFGPQVHYYKKEPFISSALLTGLGGTSGAALASSL